MLAPIHTYCYAAAVVLADSHESRESITFAVWGLIAHGGIEAVTFRRVAKQADVSVGRVQHHFATREVLVRAACEAMIDIAHAQYQELPDEPLERLRHILVHAVPDSPEGRIGASVWYAFLAKSADDPEIARLLAETKRGTEDECARLLAELHASEPHPRDTRGDARVLLGLADGLIMRVLVDDLTGDEARAVLETELAARVANAARHGR